MKWEFVLTKLESVSTSRDSSILFFYIGNVTTAKAFAKYWGWTLTTNRFILQIVTDSSVGFA